MILRAILVLFAACVGYLGAVVAAFLYWSFTGQGGPDYMPLLVVLFGLAPLAALVAGVITARAGRPRTVRRAEPAAPPAVIAPVRRNGPLQWAIAIAGALIVGGIMLAFDYVPTHVRYIPR